MTVTTTQLHLYKTGDAVTLKPGNRGAPYARCVFRIVKVMPANGAGFQYRIRDEKDWREHVAQESQLSPAKAGAWQ